MDHEMELDIELESARINKAIEELEAQDEIAHLKFRLQAMTDNAERLAKHLLDAQHYDFDWNGAIEALAAHRKLMEVK